MPISRSSALYQASIGTLLLLVAATMLVPFLYIFAISFTDPEVYRSNTFILWPERWSFAAYELVLSGHGIVSALKASLFITLIGTPMAVTVSSSFAYMLSKRSLPGRKTMLNLIVFTLLFSPGLIPGYLLIKELHILDTWWSIILPGVTNAWTLLVMKSFFESLPGELEEAAIMDGCNPLQTYFHIILPLSKAPLAAFTLFFAVGYWNTYFNAVLYLNDVEKWPLQLFLQQVINSASLELFADPATLANLTQNKSPVPPEVVKMAAVIVVTLPILIVYPFLQKHFAKGVLIGSVKG
ncbi:carbohydrate ABC transporter permease [Paenibacillus sp. FSL H7-0331]|uniref:carbohydrate ABC transporter permease n=1 Tax=Paenibacillus sp. FSL H7-0331 TaxID=1920421 RepID=UPI00096E6697|nr:carbohydrate ABC transporter permease [Paenibacillus sp. FSL H7-0331]OMF06080.1 ABC transporter permease [Paenibacillus sp. FSL H7-0331]